MKTYRRQFSYSIYTLIIPLLMTFILLSLLGITSVFAQGTFTKSGEITGGYADFIPISLKSGEAVEGTFVARKASEPLRVSVKDPTNKEVYNFGELVNGDIYFAAKVTGMHRLVVANTNTYAVGTRGYTINYSIVQAFPAKYDTNVITAPIPNNPSATSIPQSTTPSQSANVAIDSKTWTIIGTVTVVALVTFIYFKFILPIIGGTTKRRTLITLVLYGGIALIIAIIFFWEQLMIALAAVIFCIGTALALKARAKQDGSTSSGNYARSNSENGGDIYVHQQRPCPRCGGTGRVEGMPIATVQGITYRCKQCGGSGWIWT